MVNITDVKQILQFAIDADNLNGYGGTKPGESGDYLVLAHMPNYLPWEITLDDGNT